MTIGELKQIIEETGLPDNTTIVLASDAEGNDFHLMGGYSVGRFRVQPHVFGGGEYDDLLDTDEQGPRWPKDAVLCLWPM